MANDCTLNADTLLVKFKDSIFYLWFDKLSDDLIKKFIQSILDCPPTKQIYTDCPNIFCCWILREIAIVLNAFGIEEDAQGIPIVPSLSDDPLISYVKKDVVRDESREYFQPMQNPCTNCDDFPLAKIKVQAQSYLDMCKGSKSLLGGVGTNYGCAKTCKPSCEKDEYRGGN